MRRYLVVFFISVTTIVFSQKIDVNTKNGFGVNGYDVVSYFNNNPVKGSKTYKTNHNGTTYKFASEKTLTAFKNNPEKYLPQYGGYCAYAVGKKNIKMKIDPETFKIINGKLYLFYNFWMTNTSKLWDEEKDIKNKADSNWQTLKYIK